MELPTVEEMRAISIRDLRKICVKHSLTVRGKKEEVILRINALRLGLQVPKAAPPIPPAISFEQVARERIARSSDVRYNIYPRDPQRQRVRKQTQFYVPDVTREELEDDNTSDSEGIQCDGDDSESMHCGEDQEEEEEGSVAPSEPSVMDEDLDTATEKASDSSVSEADSVLADQELEEQTPFADSDIVEDEACRSAEKAESEAAPEPDALLARMSDEIDRCPC